MDEKLKRLLKTMLCRSLSNCRFECDYIEKHNFRKELVQKKHPFAAIVRCHKCEIVLFNSLPTDSGQNVYCFQCLKVGGHEKNNVVEIPFKYAPRGVELVEASVEGAAPLPTELREQRESRCPIAYIKARATAVRRVTLSVVHRYGRMHTLAPKIPRKISCPPTFKAEQYRCRVSKILC